MAELNDPDRLAPIDPALLHLDADEVLDACVDEAARLADAPVALVTLVLRHVQLFRAHRGLPPDLALSCATSRRSSFCQVVVRDERPLVIEDAPRDARVPQDLVDLYGIRAYAGVPVRMGGQPVGSLCVIDNTPRRFPDEVVEALEALAEKVGARLSELVGPEEVADAPPSMPPSIPPSMLGDRLRLLRESARLLARAMEAVAPVLEQMSVAGLPAAPSVDRNLRADLRAAVACHADLVTAARELSAEAARLARAAPEPLLQKILADARAIERDLGEAAPLVRISQGVLTERLSPGAAAKVSGATREALGFHGTALGAARRILRSIDALGSTWPAPAPAPAAPTAGPGGAP